MNKQAANPFAGLGARVSGLAQNIGNSAFGHSLLRGRGSWLAGQGAQGRAPASLAAQLESRSILPRGAVTPIEAGQNRASMAGGVTRALLPAMAAAGGGGLAGGWEGAASGGLAGLGATAVKGLASRTPLAEFAGGVSQGRVNELADIARNPEYRSFLRGTLPGRIDLNDASIPAAQREVARQFQNVPGGNGTFPYPHGTLDEVAKVPPRAPGPLDPLLGIRPTPTATPDHLYGGMTGDSRQTATATRKLLPTLTHQRGNGQLLATAGAAVPFGSLAGTLPRVIGNLSGQLTTMGDQAAAGKRLGQTFQDLKNNPDAQVDLNTVSTDIGKALNVPAEDIQSGVEKMTTQALQKMIAEHPEKMVPIVQKAMSDPKTVEKLSEGLNNMPEEQRAPLIKSTAAMVNKLKPETKAQLYSAVTGSDPSTFGSAMLQRLMGGLGDFGGQLAGMLGMGDMWQSLPFEARAGYTASGLVGMISILGLLLGSGGMGMAGLGLAGLAGLGTYGASQGWFGGQPLPPGDLPADRGPASGA